MSRGLFAPTNNENSLLKRLGLADLDFLTPENFSDFEGDIDQLIGETERQMSKVEEEDANVKRISRELDDTMMKSARHLTYA